MMDEIVVKVPAPFCGVENVGFTARYPEQEAGERLRDVPFVIEGPALPMRQLAEWLALFPQKAELIAADGLDEAYSWTFPIQLTDEICLLSFRDLSLEMAGDDEERIRSRTWNLLRPLAFTFLRDCVRLAELKLSDQIAVVVERPGQAQVDLELPLTAIVSPNGTRLLRAA